MKTLVFRPSLLYLRANLESFVDFGKLIALSLVGELSCKPAA
jgi:hypothetical protein